MTLQHLSPILWTKNLEETTSFYANVSGFSVHSNLSDFVSHFKDDVQIMFVVPVEELEDCKDPESKEEFSLKPTRTGHIYITTNNADDIWDSIQGKAEIQSGIADRQYLMTDLSILDNNGYELCLDKTLAVDKSIVACEMIPCNRTHFAWPRSSAHPKPVKEY